MLAISNHVADHLLPHSNYHIKMLDPTGNKEYKGHNKLNGTVREL